MPFKSARQRKYLFANHPTMAKRWVKDAKQSHKKVTQTKSK